VGLRLLVGCVLVGAWVGAGGAQTTSGGNAPVAASHLPKELVAAQQALLEKRFVEAKELFAAYLRGHAGDVDAEVGVADAELALHEYEAAEVGYRQVVAQQPQRWLAHKNLVIIEAELGRWDEFDRERAVLRAARERGAPGISARESDVIDAFDVAGEHWIVREYYEPVGRSLTRYNFEQFGADGKVKTYVSLESAEAAEAALAGGDVRVGGDAGAVVVKDFALNFYTGKAHGTVARYPGGEPRYERVRRDVMRWVRVRAGR
jgi:tetratricopeptide (TPR) repeat protein